MSFTKLNNAEENKNNNEHQDVEDVRADREVDATYDTLEDFRAAQKKKQPLGSIAGFSGEENHSQTIRVNEQVDAAYDEQEWFDKEIAPLLEELRAKLTDKLIPYLFTCAPANVEGDSHNVCIGCFPPVRTPQVYRDCQKIVTGEPAVYTSQKIAEELIKLDDFIEKLSDKEFTRDTVKSAVRSAAIPYMLAAISQKTGDGLVDALREALR